MEAGVTEPPTTVKEVMLVDGVPSEFLAETTTDWLAR